MLITIIIGLIAYSSYYCTQFLNFCPMEKFSNKNSTLVHKKRPIDIEHMCGMQYFCDAKFFLNTLLS